MVTTAGRRPALALTCAAMVRAQQRGGLDGDQASATRAVIKAALE